MYCARLVCLVLLLVSTAPSVLMAANTTQVRGLRGIKAVRVLVEDLNAATQRAGLQKEYLQALAEKQLSHTGLTVLQPHEPGKVPIVYVRLSAVVASEAVRAPLSFYLTVQVKQLAVLMAEDHTASKAVEVSGRAPLLATTWENGTMVMLDRVELLFYVQTVLTNLLNELIDDYQSANKGEG